MSAKGLCARLVERLRSAGLVTYVLRTYCPARLYFVTQYTLTHTDLSSFHEHDALRTAQWDSLEKALTVYRSHNGLHRRVDLICAIPETYWTAVLGWTGGTMFERDLRLAAKSMCVRSRFATQKPNLNLSASGLKFDSTGMYVH
jgi:hypothetical protein